MLLFVTLLNFFLIPSHLSACLSLLATSCYTPLCFVLHRLFIYLLYDPSDHITSLSLFFHYIQIDLLYLNVRRPYLQTKPPQNIKTCTTSRDFRLRLCNRHSRAFSVGKAKKKNERPFQFCVMRSSPTKIGMHYWSSTTSTQN